MVAVASERQSSAAAAMADGGVRVESAYSPFIGGRGDGEQGGVATRAWPLGSQLTSKGDVPDARRGSAATTARGRARSARVAERAEAPWP